jgi:tRNA(fMet)-specific endonuclease VapC
MSNQSREYLIDSSILIPYIRRNQVFVTRLDALSNKYVSPTVAAELAFGAYRSRDPVDGIQKVEAIVNLLPAIPINIVIGSNFAEMKNALVRTNQLIPDNDIWIAVTAIAYDLTLVARDAHFTRLTPYGLQCQLW